MSLPAAGDQVPVSVSGVAGWLCGVGEPFVDAACGVQNAAMTGSSRHAVQITDFSPFTAGGLWSGARTGAGDGVLV
ncbi:hypothetical protein ACF1AE_16995 [Streptomyces sp. NPDC014986]|uniref:hypothetical protein n=1 Tax=Streptomyces sp. NPDC014986 TaxID=3364934 RepID=UPI0036FADE70